ncbi:MAG: hypothetical protein AMXMBFR84_46030 [Candidatus Hydrogenedentota bacterium]
MSFAETFFNPDHAYSLMPFWFLNDALEEDELRRQINDFHDHGVYGIVPHARIGVPESIPYMSERWIHFIKVIVEHSASKSMRVVLYDEGMYPSGSCHGRVVAENPRFATRALVRRGKPAVLGADEFRVCEDEKYTYINTRSMGHIRGIHFGTDDGEPGAPPSADLLNPDSTAAFFRLGLDPYYESMKEHFGTTIIGVFTDEPDVMGRGHIKDAFPWTWDFEHYLQPFYQSEPEKYLPALFDEDHPRHDTVLGVFRSAIQARLRETYYGPYSEWCEQHGVALTGHPAQPDEIGLLRYFHIPGQDIVWRYIEPYKSNALEGPQSTQGKCSASAQHHYGRARNSNECFGAYGWEFTEDEMWWVTNWLLVRGVNLIYPHAFYYSIREQRRDERPPDVGPNNIWWDRYKHYADYVRRLCWVNGEGTPECHIAILGLENRLPWRAAKVLFEHQRDFLYLDKHMLRKHVYLGADGFRIGAMDYKVIVIDGAEYLDAESADLLKPLVESGRVVAFQDAVSEHIDVAVSEEELLEKLDALTPVDIRVSPSTPHLRYQHLRLDGLHVYLFSNEGRETIAGTLEVSAPGSRQWWDPESGLPIDLVPEELSIPPTRMRLLVCSAG